MYTKIINYCILVVYQHFNLSENNEIGKETNPKI